MKGKHEIDIQHPEAWELLVSIEDSQVRYILFTPTVANSLVIGEVARTEDSIQGLEDAVYDSKVLLNEYKRVRVVVHPQHFILLPLDATDDDCSSLVSDTFPHDEGNTAVCAMPLNGVKVAYLLPRGLQAFLGRTFNYPEIVPHLVPLCEHFKELEQDENNSRMFLHLSEERINLAIYRDGALMCANTFSFTNAQDAAFFSLSAWRGHGLNQLTDELRLLGDNNLLAEMTPVLRNYVKHVMPAAYPAAAMRLGRNAMQAPFELILLALCE